MTDGADAVVAHRRRGPRPASATAAARGYRAARAVTTRRPTPRQIALVRRALDRGTPLLGICRGHQVINVALGGTLVQHLDDDGGAHRGAGGRSRSLMVDHDVELVGGSRARAALLGTGGRRAERAPPGGRPGRRAASRVVGRASDGSVEAVEHATAPVTGVQWHPEDRGAERGQLPLLLVAWLARPAARRRRLTPGAALAGVRRSALGARTAVDDRARRRAARPRRARGTRSATSRRPGSGGESASGDPDVVDEVEVALDDVGGDRVARATRLFLSEVRLASSNRPTATVMVLPACVVQEQTVPSVGHRRPGRRRAADVAGAVVAATGPARSTRAVGVDAGRRSRGRPRALTR